MGLPILILGYSGSGKSASLRSFGAEELALVNVNGKPLPFRTRFASSLRSDNYAEITAFLKRQTVKAIAVDDTQYLMTNEFMRRSAETGYNKFTEIAKNFWSLVRSVEALPDDVIVYFLSHLDTDDSGRQKAKTIGKLLDEKITVEGMFTTVLKTVVSDGKYAFATQTDGKDTCKSPIGLFDSMYIDNDLKLVDGALRTYYGLVPEHICADCGKTIMPAGKRSVETIVEGSIHNYGRKLCMGCVKKLVKEASANASSPISE